MFRYLGVITFLITVKFVDYKFNTKTMAKTGLLLLSNISKMPCILGNISRYVSETLYISIANSSLPPISYSEWINGIYKQATKECDHLDIRVLIGNLKDSQQPKNINTYYPIDIVMYDNPQTISGDTRGFMKKIISKLTSNFDVVNIDTIGCSESEVQKEYNPDYDKVYQYAALGGTFDRLHNGHKILLSQGILRTTKGLTVGVTDTNMIKSKKLWELIEPLDVRIKKLKLFLNDIDSTLNYNVVPIQDVYGPTKDDEKLELLVVSQETVRGGEAVNKKRKENNIAPLAVHCIDLANDSKNNYIEEEAKVSSSNTRIRLLGTLLKEPKENTNIPPSPYIIGLTGGIASGKTNITEKLRELGAGIVNCDLLAHEIYKPGTPMNATIAETFGHDILHPNGEVDRKKLGSIVFNDPSRLIELNNLLWPAIIELAQKKVKELGDNGYKIIVMEAAVLIQANWQQYCHQVWTSIIPPEEAVKRMVERNNLTEEAAKLRLSSQPSNSEQVAAANVVFSSLWRYEFTSTQVSKAWNSLQTYLKYKNKL